MSQCCHPWHADCLSAVTILAMSQDNRKLRRLAKQFGLLEEGSNPDGVEIFQRLHEGCHHDPELAKALGKDLDDRFRSTLARVRSLNLERIKTLEMNWPLPLLWAVLRDDRPEVRAHGRYLVHALLWNALRCAAEDKGEESDLREANLSLEAQATRQKTEVESLRRELKRTSAEKERLEKLLEAGECRRETVGAEDPGRGRLTREARKLRHDLERERERVKHLEKIVSGSGFSLPEHAPEGAVSEPLLKTECKSLGTCPIQNRQDLPSDSDRCAEKTDCCKDCPLDGLRVAVVGGLGRMLPEYREVVRQLGAELLFHDGELRNGSYKLKSVVCGADIIVFITSVNSHGALSVVRAVCKKNGKKFIAVKETGAESLARTLRKCAA